MTAMFEDDFDLQDSVEVHWSSSTILAIFFAASLVSAVFFGLGYSFGGAGNGKHSFSFNSAPSNIRAPEPAVQALKSAPLPASNQPFPIANFADNTQAQPTAGAPSTPPVALRTVAMTPVARTEAPVTEKKSAAPLPIQQQNATVSVRTSAHIMVQVGAIGDRKDAERLVAALRRKGFHAGIYTENHDKFLHVQIGPFKDAAHAQSKRHQLMASGFRAILKSVS